MSNAVGSTSNSDNTWTSVEVVSTYINIKVRKDLQTKILSIFPWPAKDYLTIYLISNRSWYLFKTNKFVIFEQKNNCDFQGPDIKEKSLDAGGRKSSSSWWCSSDCFVDESLLSELTEHIIPQSDSIGMNEQVIFLIDQKSAWCDIMHKPEKDN